MKSVFYILLFWGVSMNAVGEEFVISESMFSGVYDLSNNSEELLLRIHPKKRASYIAIINGGAKVKMEGEEITIRDIQLYLNSNKGVVKKLFSSIATTNITHVKDTTTVTGFDKEGEPLIHQMKDGSIRVVFSSMPPSVQVNHEVFEIDSFEKDFQAALDVEVIHDDREIFHIQNPKPDTVAKIKKFVQEYRVKN